MDFTEGQKMCIRDSGVVSKDDLVLTSGTYQIDAESHGLSGKDSVRIASGSYTIVSGKDGIHAENADDTSLGFVYLAAVSYTHLDVYKRQLPD